MSFREVLSLVPQQAQEMLTDPGFALPSSGSLQSQHRRKRRVD